MEKPIEERLAGIESGITRLTEMQGCVFDMLLVLHKITSLISRMEWSTSSVQEFMRSAHQSMNYALTFMFGAVAMLSIAISMLTLYATTDDFVFRISGIVAGTLGAVLIFLSVRYVNRADKERKTFETEWRQAREQAQSMEQEAAALDESLAQVVNEWKELVPDDLVSEPRNDAPGPKDSPDRS